MKFYLIHAPRIIGVIVAGIRVVDTTAWHSLHIAFPVLLFFARRRFIVNVNRL